MAKQRKQKRKARPPGPQARGERVTVPVSALRPNPWNPNEQSPFIRDKQARSLRRFGILKELVVRETGPHLAAGEGYSPVKGYEIIDGEHRWKDIVAGKLSEVEVRNLGVVADNEAKELTVVLNEIRGEQNPRKLSELIAQLDAVGLRGEFTDVAPYTEEEVESLLRIRELEPKESGASAEHGKRKAAQGAPYPFQVGPHKGQLPQELGKRMETAYLAIADAMRTADAVVVAGRLCDLLEQDGTSSIQMDAN